MDKGRGRGKDRRGEEEGVTGEGQVGREGMGRRQGGRRAGRETDLKTAWWLSFSDEMRVRGVLYMRRSVQIDVLLTHYAVGSRHIKSAISPKRLKIERNLL